MNYLLEDKRNDLVAQGKRGEREKGDGKTRYEKRVKSRVASVVKDFNQIDMQSLYKYGILTFNVPVTGETDNYKVRIKYGGFLDILQNQLKRQNDRLDLRVVTRALLEAFNRDDVFIHCTCLHPSTKIKLLDGTSPTIAEMKERFDKGEKLYVYSADENGDFKPGEVEKVWVTKTTSEFIKITLDNGEELITTPDHLYMLRDGTYEQAQNLIVGQSLMPLYTFINNAGYEVIKLNSKSRGRNSTYKLVADYYKKDEIGQVKLRVKPDDNMKYDIAIHHIDFNKLNNTPENLQIMTAREHWDYHSSLMSEKWKDNNFRDKTIASVSTPEHGEKIKITKGNWSESQRQNFILKNSESNKGKHFRPHTEEEKLLMSERRKGISLGPCSEEKKLNIGKGIKKAYSNFTEEQWESKINLCKDILCSEESTQKRREGISKYWEEIKKVLTPEEIKLKYDHSQNNYYVNNPKPESSKEKMRLSHLNKSKKELEIIGKKRLISIWIKRINKLLSQGIEINLNNFLSTFAYPNQALDSLHRYWEDFDAFIDELALDDRYNHKIKSIEYIDLPNTPVYDIKVKDWHNFAVSAGIYLHNCPDYTFRFSYWSSIKNINAGPPEKRPAKITNPKNNLGSGCKHIMLVLANSSWIITLARVIYNYIIYMEKHQKKLYADLMYPAIYGKEYEEPIQLDIEDEEELDNTIDNDTSRIDKANEIGRTRGQFQKGNKYRFKPNERPSTQDQISIEDIKENN